MSRLLICAFLSTLGALTGFQLKLNAQSGIPPSSISSLNVLVIAGQNSANVLKPASVVPPMVEVRDANNHPVIGAIVTFSAPLDEPTVRFPNGNRIYSLVTDTSGRAAVENMAPLGSGRFNIDARATYEDSSAESTIPQANYPTWKSAAASGAMNQANRIELPNHGLSKGAKVTIILVAVAAAAGIGVFLATRGHSNSNSSTVSAGTATVGAP